VRTTNRPIAAVLNPNNVPRYDKINRYSGSIQNDINLARSERKVTGLLRVQSTFHAHAKCVQTFNTSKSDILFVEKERDTLTRARTARLFPWFVFLTAKKALLRSKPGTEKLEDPPKEHIAVHFSCNLLDPSAWKLYFIVPSLSL
jgi:hypothetical protein